MIKSIDGVCYFHSETGTEGGYWAFQDRRFINESSVFGRQYDYTGLHILSDGDYLRIFDMINADIIIWEGIISLHNFLPFREESGGYWIHNEQIGIDRSKWAQWFFNEYPAQLIKK